MPEEINRLVTDSISDLLFISEPNGEVNLKKEGVDPQKMHYVGNVMIDSLINFLPVAETSAIMSELNLEENSFLLVTLHRPSNVDEPENIKKILQAFDYISRRIPIVFPIHPRTEKNLEIFELKSMVDGMKNLKIVPPLGYLDFIQLEKNCRFVITDSG
jgi:UDP-N-acetylglucosamine 2-epimerase (non-hydrolysing)